jgi:hypothetical protein
MDRLPYSICKPYYDALGIDFERSNPNQFEVIKAQDRFPLIVGGERGGKSYATAAILVPHIDLLPEIRRERFYHDNGKLKYDWTKRERIPLVPDVAIFGPSYAEPRIEFSYLEDWLRQLDNIAYISKPQEGPWRMVSKDGVVVSTWSTDNPGNIRGIDLEVAVAAECGNMEFEAIERIQGRIGAKRGFCIYSGTMENAKRWYMEWAIEGERQNRWGVKTYSLPSWGNLAQFPGGRDDPEIKRWEQFYTEDVFLTRVAAVPMPPRDRVLREFSEQHIKKVQIPRDSDGHYACEFHVAIDPGYLPSAYAALLVASWDTADGKYWYVFDELYEQQVGNEVVIEWLKKHKFYKYFKFDSLTIDTSAKRHADGNEPAIEKFTKLTKFKAPYTHYWHENALIDRVRTTAKQNLIAIHPNCHGLIAECGLGQPVFPDMHPWRYPTARDGIILNEKPEDKWNHSAKALGYLLLRHLGLVERMGERPRSRNRITDKNKNPNKRNIFNWRRSNASTN